jgi:predicted MFS family arabinose efflux permease
MPGRESGLSGVERRNLRLLTIAEASGGLGTQMTAVVIPILLLSEFDSSALVVATFAAARYVPYIVLGPWLGSKINDRSPRAMVLVGDAIRMACLILAATLGFLGSLTVPALLALVLVISAARVQYDLALATFIVNGFVKRHLLRVNSQLDAVFGAAESAGPAVAGAIVSAAGPFVAMVADSIARAVSFVSVALTRVPEPAPNAPAGQRDLGDAAPRPSGGTFRDSLDTIFGDRILRVFLAAAALSNGGLMILQGVALVVLVERHGLSATGAGFVLTCMGVGGIAGSLVGPWLIRRVGLREAAVVGSVASIACPLLMVPTVGTTWVVVIALGYFCLGAGISVSSMAMRRYRQEAIPAEKFASVSGAYSSLIMGSLPAGALIGGVLASAWGLTAPLVASAIVMAASAVVSQRSLRVQPTVNLEV